jgi:hypothetical protein
MSRILRTVLLLPATLAIAVVLLLAIALRVACTNLLRDRPCAAL